MPKLGGGAKEVFCRAVRKCLRACLKMGRGSAAGEFWVGQGGERRGRPPAVCSARTNAVQAGKTRRPEGLGGKGPLAALLVGHRPLRVCFLRAPCQSNPSLPNRTHPHFQTGSKRKPLSIFLSPNSLSLRSIMEGLHCDLGPLESRLAGSHCDGSPRTSRRPLNRETSSEIATQFDLPVAGPGSLLREVEGCSIIIRLDDPKTRHEFGPVVKRSGTDDIRTAAVVDELRVAWGLDPSGGIKDSTEPSDRSGMSRWRSDLQIACRLRRSFQR